MSWGISFDAYLPRVRKDNIKHCIEHEKETIAMYERMIVALACDTTIGSGDVPRYEAVAMGVHELLSVITESASKLGLLEQAEMAEKVEEE